jgi:hypothetical protein
MQMKLTPFRKKRRPASKRPRRPVPRTSPKTAKRPRQAPAFRPPGKDWLDTLDAIDERCARIETMAGLLRACDDPEEMTVKLAAQAGAFMADDLREVKGLLAALGKGTR